MESNNDRRGFLQRLLAAGGVAVSVPAAQAQGGNPGSGEVPFLPKYARAQNYKSLKQGSWDRTGGNRDWWTIAPGATLEVFKADGPGVISHIWFTIAVGVQIAAEEIANGRWACCKTPTAGGAKATR